MTFDGVDGLTATTVLNAKLSFCPLVVSLLHVILSVAKDLAVSKTVDRYADLEIFRFAQDDIVTVCHSERSEGSPRCLHIQHIINRHPEEGQAQGVWNVIHLPCPDVGIYLCLRAVESDLCQYQQSTIINGRLPRNCIDRQGYHERLCMQFLAMTRVKLKSAERKPTRQILR